MEPLGKVLKVMQDFISSTVVCELGARAEDLDPTGKESGHLAPLLPYRVWGLRFRALGFKGLVGFKCP